ncbi:hypothetical protein ACOMHN_063263 [Nucella lapillus]
MEEEKREEVDQNQGTETVQSIPGLPLKERGGGAARPPDRPPDRVSEKRELSDPLTEEALPTVAQGLVASCPQSLDDALDVLAVQFDSTVGVVVELQAAIDSNCCVGATVLVLLR